MPTAKLTIDLDAAYITVDGVVLFTAPHGWEPVAQIAGELDEMLDAGKIDRATYKDLSRQLWSSELGMAKLRTQKWQAGGIAAA